MQQLISASVKPLVDIQNDIIMLYIYLYNMIYIYILCIHIYIYLRMTRAQWVCMEAETGTIVAVLKYLKLISR